MPRLRIRQHVNPLRKEYQRTHRSPLELPTDRPIEVELGCADAQFTLQRAARERDRYFIGIEIREELAKFVQAEAEAAGLDNCRIIFANINTDLATLFGAAKVDRYHVLFPDPWFKKRQQKRRVMNSALCDDLFHTLKPDGDLYFASDVWEVALEAMATLEMRSDLFENLREPWSFWPKNPYDARSKRDEGCQEKGLPVWRMWYRKVKRN